MRPHTLSLLAATVVLTALASAGVASARTAEAPLADTYYGCSSGYSFQVSSGAARCYKPASERIQALVACTSYTVPGTTMQVGLFPKADHSGSTDYCAGQSALPGVVNNTFAFVRGCAEGWSKRVQPGTDICFKRVPESIIAPTVAVTR
jgi:hypothetical protein